MCGIVVLENFAEDFIIHPFAITDNCTSIQDVVTNELLNYDFDGCGDVIAVRYCYGLRTDLVLYVAEFQYVVS